MKRAAPPLPALIAALTRVVARALVPALILPMLLGPAFGVAGAVQPVAEGALPIPPIPPARLPSQDAPVPDLNAHGPLGADQPSSLTLNTDINRREAPNTSLGYAPGSRYRLDDTRRPLSVPGLQWHVPIQ